MKAWSLSAIIAATLLSPVSVAAQSNADYEADINFALAEIKERCGHFFELKQIDWAAVSAEFKEAAKKVESDGDHMVLLYRLLARLKDGHARVVPLEKGKNVKWPLPYEKKTGPGMFWCRIGDQIHVKNSWSAAEAAGIEPGMEVVKVNGEPVTGWIRDRQAELADLVSFSTPHQLFFYTCHWGLADPAGTGMTLSVRPPGSRRRPKEIEFKYTDANPTPWGPAFFPPNLDRTRDLNFGILESGYGYIHIRRCKADVNDQLDTALEKIDNVPGMIVDFRGNSGGGFDHDAFMGRFIPKGEQIAFAKRYAGAGEHPYGGPVVGIVDATIRSAGETAAGTLKEDGRAWFIGESPTAGMSASKKTIELPSGLFGLYVAVYSNKKRYQDGRGIEGIGLIPHEKVEFDPEDLENETDTMIKIAEERLRKFPQEKVPYDPANFGWKG